MIVSNETKFTQLEGMGHILTITRRKLEIILLCSIATMMITLEHLISQSCFKCLTQGLTTYFITANIFSEFRTTYF